MSTETADAPVENQQVEAPVESTTVDTGPDRQPNYEFNSEVAAFFSDKPRPVPKATETPRAPQRPAPKPEAELEPEAELQDDPADEPEATEQDENTEGGDAPAKTVAFDEGMLQLAELHGYDRAEVEELFPNPDVLSRHLAAMDRRALAQLSWEQEQATQASEGRQQANQQAQPPANPQAAGAPAPGLPSFEKFKIEIDPDEVSEGELAVLNGINEHYHGVVEKLNQTALGALAKSQHLEQQVSMLMQVHQTAAVQRMKADVDDFFSKLGDEYRTEFGNGSVDDLRDGSKEVANRQAILDAALQLEHIARSQGRQPLPLAANLKRALQIQYFDKHEELARKKLAAESAQRRSQAVARPTQRRTPPVVNEQTALSNLRRRMKAKGFASDGGTPDHVAFFAGQS